MPPDLSLPNQHAIVGLGANLGSRNRTLRAAITLLESTPGCTLVARSAVYDTEPVGPPQPRYRNAAVRIVWAGTPEGLLSRLLEIERSLGRVRHAGERWGPRTVDLDLLLFGHEIRESATLTIPHPRLLERSFVLAPLLDVAPDLEVRTHLAALGSPPVCVSW